MLLAIAVLVYVTLGRLYVHGGADHGPPGRSLGKVTDQWPVQRYKTEVTGLEADGLNLWEYHRTI